MHEAALIYIQRCLYCLSRFQLLHKNGINLRSRDGRSENYGIRTQFVLFDLPAMAAHLNVKQFNGYHGCPDCKVHGVAHGREIFYPHSDTPSEPKTQYDYAKFSCGNYSRTQSIGILGSTPLTDILILPDQCPKDYMHMVAGGHFKWLVNMWQSMFTVDAFDEGARYLTHVDLPRCFGYQFLPLNVSAGWKTKHYRDFLLYVAPVFTVLFIPDAYAEHFLHYFVYVRTLHYFDSINDLDKLDDIFGHYARSIEPLYGHRASLCSLHMHSHLVRQVINHGALSMTSCFARESYLSSAIKICHGTRNVLQQFVDWYDIDQAIRPPCSFTVDRVFSRELIFDQKYVNRSLLEQMHTTFAACTVAQSITVRKNLNELAYARFNRGLAIFHSSVYSRGGRAISSFASVVYSPCLSHSHLCFAELLFFFSVAQVNFAFAKIFPCNQRSLSTGLSLAQGTKKRLDDFFRFFNTNVFKFFIVPVSSIDNLAIRLSWPEDKSIFCFTTVPFQSEHD